MDAREREPVDTFSKAPKPKHEGKINIPQGSMMRKRSGVNIKEKQPLYLLFERKIVQKRWYGLKKKEA